MINVFDVLAKEQKALNFMFSRDCIVHSIILNVFTAVTITVSCNTFVNKDII